MPFSIGLPELLVILAICLIVFGAGKLPGVGRALGQSIREFRQASQTNPPRKADSEEQPEDRPAARPGAQAQAGALGEAQARAGEGCEEPRDRASGAD